MPRTLSPLVVALKAALKSGLRRETDREWLANFQDELFTDVWKRGLVLGNSEFQRLCSVLAGIEDIKSVEHWILYPGEQGSGESITVESIVWWLLDRSVEASPEIASRELINFIKTKKASILWVTLLYGLVVLGPPVKLGCGFQLIPFQALPNSRQKSAFRRRHEGGGFAPDVSYEPVALTYTETSPDVLVPPDFRAPEVRKPSGSMDWSTVATRMDAVTAVLSLLGDVAPLASGSWVQAYGPGVPAAGAPSFTWSPEVRPFQRIRCDGREARRMVTRFFSMTEDSRTKIMTPLHRLAQSMRELTIEDAAIDLRTALEGALVPGASTEVQYRLALNGAWLLGENQASRRQIFDQLKKIYGLCSRVVHTGRIESKSTQVASSQIKDAQKLTQNILRNIIKKRGKVDFETIVFGS